MEQNQNAAVIAVIPYENVYATKLLRIGDEVLMNMDKEARGWGRKGVPDGTKGTVMGFYVYHDTRNHNRDKNPGIYRGNGAAVVLWEDGSVGNESNDVAIPKHILEERRKDTKYMDAFEKQLKVYDLPKFDYMVGNLIDINSRWKNGPHIESGTITNIEFDEIINLRTGELLPIEKWKDERIFHVDLEGGGSSRFSISEIRRIVDKGNYWAWENDKTQLKFKDLQSECAFYASIGKRQQMRSPRSGNYKWEIEDAMEAIRRGDADAMGKSLALFGAEPFPTVTKFDDDLVDLALRTRAATLEGFAPYEPKELPVRKYTVEYTLPNTHRTITATKEIGNEVYLKPSSGDHLQLEGNEYIVNHSYNLDDDDPVNLTPVVLMTDSIPMARANGVEDQIDIPLAVRIEIANRFFDDLAQQGWMVDNSKFIAP